MSKSKKLVCGVGINDVDYVVNPVVNGQKNTNTCPYYKRWLNMLNRVYGKEVGITYRGCTVCKEWYSLTSFREWVIGQELLYGSVDGLHLDKDLLVQGNKVYSPETCIFVSETVNAFIREANAIKGDYPTGVCKDKHNNGRFLTYCNNPLLPKGKRRKHIGYFDSEQEAHDAWKRKKHQYACQLAHVQSNTVIRDALLIRYIGHGLNDSGLDYLHCKSVLLELVDNIYSYSKEKLVATLEDIKLQIEEEQ